MMVCDEQTMEVATARVYNWDVGQRRKEKGGEEGEGEGKMKMEPGGRGGGGGG